MNTTPGMRAPRGASFNGDGDDDATWLRSCCTSTKHAVATKMFLNMRASFFGKEIAALGKKSSRSVIGTPEGGTD